MNVSGKGVYYYNYGIVNSLIVKLCIKSIADDRVIKGTVAFVNGWNKQLIIN